MKRFVTGALILALVACGSDSPTPPPVDDTTPAHVGILSGDGQRAAPQSSIVASVIITDSKNRTLAGIPVTFRVIAGEGTISGANVVTNSVGVASTTWRLGRFSTQALGAKVSNFSEIVFTATLTP